MPVPSVLRSRRRAGALAVVVGAIGIALALGVAKRDDSAGERCGPGFAPHGPRCLVPEGACPSPLVATERGCDAPSLRLLVPAASMTIGPSDWEAEGRVSARILRVEAFRIDAFEVTRGAYSARSRDAGAGADGDAARAASGMTRSEAAAFCASRGGRLPTEDEWTVAAASTASFPHRYPWGETGVVCRRAAWGMERGPCAVGANGPDTVGAHPSGDSPLGIHDLAGNVAEWVAPAPAPASGANRGPHEMADTARASGTTGDEADRPTGVAKGGSWQSSLASELRIWARLELPADRPDARVGLRCVYAP